MNDLPGLRLLPDAPVPDGRTVLTNPTPPASRRSRVTGAHLAAFHTGHQSDRSVEQAAAQARKTKGHFANQEAAQKLIYLSITNATPKWTKVAGWTKALLAFKIHFGERLPD
jgi:hypothetical protein